MICSFFSFPLSSNIQVQRNHSSLKLMNTGGSVVPEHDAFFLFLKKTREISGETLFSFNLFEES